MAIGFTIPDIQYNEVAIWCIEQFGSLGEGRWGRSLIDTRNMYLYVHGKSWYFWFTIDEDAVLFRMTWDTKE